MTNLKAGEVYQTVFLSEQCLRDGYRGTTTVLDICFFIFLSLLWTLCSAFHEAGDGTRSQAMSPSQRMEAEKQANLAKAAALRDGFKNRNPDAKDLPQWLPFGEKMVTESARAHSYILGLEV